MIIMEIPAPSMATFIRGGRVLRYCLNRMTAASAAGRSSSNSTNPNKCNLRGKTERERLILNKYLEAWVCGSAMPDLTSKPLSRAAGEHLLRLVEHGSLAIDGSTLAAFSAVPGRELIDAAYGLMPGRRGP